MTSLLSVFKPFVEQKYEECVEKAKEAKPKTEFEKYEIEFLENYAYYSLNDRALDEITRSYQRSSVKPISCLLS